MKRIDIVSLVLNIILGVLYIPISIICFFMLMVSESAIDATNPVYLALIDVFCIITVLVPVLLLAGIILSLVFRIKGRSVLSLVVQLCPVAIGALNWLLLVIADCVPKVI